MREGAGGFPAKTRHLLNCFSKLPFTVSHEPRSRLYVRNDSPGFLGSKTKTTHGAIWKTWPAIVDSESRGNVTNAITCINTQIEPINLHFFVQLAKNLLQELA